MYKRTLVFIAILFFMPSLGNFALADHFTEPFCGDSIVEEGEKCAYDVGLTNQCWKEGAKIGSGNHYPLGELCFGYDHQTRKSTGEPGICVMHGTCLLGGDRYQGVPSRIVVIDKTVGIMEGALVYIFDPGGGGYKVNAYAKQVGDGPDHYLSNFCSFQYSCTERSARGVPTASEANGTWEGYAHNHRPGVLKQVKDFSNWFEAEPSEADKPYWYQTTTSTTPLELRRHGAIFGFKNPGKYVLGIWDARGNNIESEPITVCPDEFCETTEIEGTISDGHGFYVPDMEVMLSQEVKGAKDLEFTTYTDEDGWYFFEELIDKERPIRLTFTFKGKPDAQDRDRFEIRDLKAEEGSVFNTTERPVFATTRDMKIEDVPERFDFVANLDLLEGANINDYEQLDDFARLHMLSASALWFFEDVLDTVLNDPNGLRIYGNSGRGTSYYASYRHAFYLAPDDVLWNDFDEPDNGVWHEISHALHFSALTGGKNKAPTDRHSYGSYNHMGYANPGTADSYTEGFAMFMSAVMQNELEFKDHADDEPWIYRYSYSSTVNLEDNMKVWSSMGRREDMAVSALLWDLYDGGSMYGGPDDDGVSLPIETIWKALNDPEVRDVKDIFDAFSLIVPLLDLEKIFISHGVFNDENGNYKHDRGEEIGRAVPGLAFFVNWDVGGTGGRFYDVDATVGRWLLGGRIAESALDGAGPSVPRWGSADIDGDKDIAGMVLSEDGLGYESGVIDNDNDVDYGLLTDIDGDGKAEMTQMPFWVLPYEARRSFEEFPEEQIQLNVTDESGARVEEAYIVMKYQYPEEFSYRDYETRALVPGDAPLSMWIPEGATLSMHAVAGDYESPEMSIEYATFFNNLQPYSDQGEANFEIPATNAEIASAISDEQEAAAVVRIDPPPRDSEESRDDDEDGRSILFPSLILLFVIIFGLYIYKTRGRKKA